MTYLSAALFEQIPVQQMATELPEPRSPEEVLRMLSKESPQGEYSADAF